MVKRYKEFALCTRANFNPARPGTPSGYVLDLKGIGPLRNLLNQISLAREAVPQGGPAWTKKHIGLESHCKMSSWAMGWSKLNFKIVAFGCDGLEESTPKDLVKPAFLRAAESPAEPQKSSTQNKVLKGTPAGSHSLCSLKVWGLPHPFLQQMCTPLLHLAPGFARSHPCGRL